MSDLYPTKQSRLWDDNSNCLVGSKSDKSDTIGSKQLFDCAELRRCPSQKKELVVSTGRRNGVGEYVGWCFPVECLTRPGVELIRDDVELPLGDGVERGAFGKVLPQ